MNKPPFVNKISNTLSTTIHCPHGQICSGCLLQEKVDEIPLVKRAQAFLKGAPLIMGPATGWRIRAKLAVRKEGIGLFRRSSHEVISIPQCKTHHPLINEAVQLVKEEMERLGISAYDEQTGQGLIRYLQCVVLRDEQKLQLSLVAQGDISELAQALWRRTFSWHSIWVNRQIGPTNAIFGSSWQLLQGEELFWENVLDKPICFSPASFGQANLDLFELALHEISLHVKPEDRVIDLYAGIGLVGLTLQCKSLLSVEKSPYARELFLRSAAAQNREAEYLLMDAEEAGSLLLNREVIIVDPPRKGLGPKLLRALCNAYGKLIYVSCGFDSFERDCISLLESGWQLKGAKLYLLFPGSDHVETIAIFEKNIE